MRNSLASTTLCLAITLLAGAASPAVPSAASTHAVASAPKPASVAKAGPFRPVLAEGKRMAPVDITYRVLGPLTPGQPVVIELNLTPRLAASELDMEIPPTSAYRIERSIGPIGQGKLTAGLALRHSMTVTPNAGAAQDIRILVSVDVPGARYASVFRIPLANKTPDPRRPKRR